MTAHPARAMAAPILLAFCTQAAHAQALESMATYDNFNVPSLDMNKWLEGERMRANSDGGLNMRVAEVGQRHTDVGITNAGWSLPLARTARVSQLKATITVNGFEVVGCASNTTPSAARARLIGTFFNTGNPIDNSRVGDMLAQVEIARRSNSTDPEGILRITGTLHVCEDVECDIARQVGTSVPLGTVALGMPVTVSLEWDKVGKRFVYGRDGTESGTIAYTQTDYTQTSRGLKALNVSARPANCTTGATKAVMDARFQQFQVNTTGR